MTASVTVLGSRVDGLVAPKTAGQLAYEAAGDWVVEHDAPQKPLPKWETLDVRAREYWDRIGAAVRAPLITAIGAFVDSERRPAAKEALRDMLAVAGLSARAIRGLW